MSLTGLRALYSSPQKQMYKTKQTMTRAEFTPTTNSTYPFIPSFRRLKRTSSDFNYPPAPLSSVKTQKCSIKIVTTTTTHKPTLFHIPSPWNPAVTFPQPSHPLHMSSSHHSRFQPRMNANLKDTDDSKTAWQRRRREERDCGVYYPLTNNYIESKGEEDADSIASSRHEQNKSSLIKSTGNGRGGWG
jgi:hypothetical protein